MKKFLLSLFLLGILNVKAQDPGHLLWMQQPALSPDGQWIAFEYKGNLFKVPATGGPAVPLTINTAYNGYPIWSHDSRSIAFASDRYGNFDVFIMPAEGGSARRLTYNSDRDIPYDFSADNQTVYFGTDRHDIYTSARFPGDAFWMKLFKVPAKGGRSLMVNSAGTEYLHFNKTGNKFIYQDRKGYEDPWRKHHTSAITRDIWVYDVPSKSYTKVSDFAGEDREPVWGEGDSFYYLSERKGNQNLFKSALNNTTSVTQLTTFTKDPVRNLSRADNGLMAFTQGGELYTLMDGQQPRKVRVTLGADFNSAQLQSMPVRDGASEMAVSPNGKEVAFVYRGEIFVTSASGAGTKRITNTPYQERMVAFSPDGRSLLYSVEHSGSWDIYKTTLANTSEPYFYAATTLKTEPVIATPKDEFQAEYSPDGKKIAYLEERNTIRVYDIASKKTVSVLPEGINYSYQDGDQSFTWSPDSRYILAESEEGSFGSSEIVLLQADGSGARVNLTQSGYNDSRPQWGMKGRMMYWMNDKQGLRNPTRGGQSDIYAMFFDQAAWDKFQLSKDDLSLQNEQSKRDSLDRAKLLANDKKAKNNQKIAPVPVIPFNPDLKNIDNRTERITVSSANLADARMSLDGEKLYYLAKFDKDYDLWVTDLRTHDTKVLAKLNVGGGALELSKDGKTLFVLAGGKLMKVGEEDGKMSLIAFNTTVDLDAAAERAYIFDHAYKEVKKKFFDPNLQGVDWDYYHTQYANFLPHINNNYDFQVLLSEFLGELNGSHTGGRYYANFPNGDETAALGLIYDITRTGDGLMVADVITGGPFDVAKSKLRKGYIIDRIDDEPVLGGTDWAPLLNHKSGKFTRISFHDPKTGTTYQETIKPISPRMETSTLLYNRWTKLMEHLTDSLSKGQIGYVHVRSMDDPSFRVTFDKVLGRNYGKKALIVDTRFNGGGWLHDDLATFLSGKQYLTFHPQGHNTVGGESMGRWTKPSCVLMSEGNYSDAFIFPYVYQKLGIGKLIGMPVAGTGTAVWWERQIDPTLVFGIPMIGTQGVGETHVTENHQVDPDIRILNDYNLVLQGQDQQLEAAVKEMLKTVANK